MILKSKRILMIVMLALSLMLPGAVFAQSPDQFVLTVIHTNDFHDFEPYALARKASIIKKIRAEAKNVVLVDAGDIFARGPYHKVFYGELEMAAMNAMNYDVWELGNNEFKGAKAQEASDEKMYNLVRQAKFPTLCANVKTLDGNYLPGVEPYTIKEVNGLKVGIIGVSSMKIKGYKQSSNKLVEDPLETVSALIPTVKDQSDIQLLLSHAGLSQDVQIDMKLANSGLSLIIGADDHYVIAQPIYRSGGIPIVQAGGEDNIYLGRIDLTFENKDGKWVLVKQKGLLYEINDTVPMDAEIKKIIDNYLSKAQKPAA